MDRTEEHRRRLPRYLGILLTIGLGAGIPEAAAQVAVLIGRRYGLAIVQGANLPYLYLQHGLQLVMALAAIAIVRLWVRADYGLHWPRGKTYFAPAIVWGAGLAVLATGVSYLPQILAHTAPRLDYPFTPANIGGWLAFEGVYVGPTEEIPFRALLVTFLAATAPGKVRLGRFEMNQAGVIVAVIFALLHITSFWTSPWPLALAQQGYAFVLGVLYAYWLEKSGSVVAPMIAHNVSDGLVFVILYAWIGLAGAG